MIEWSSKLPKTDDKRIHKSFCFWPKRCHQDMVVWLGFVYLLQTYFEKDHSNQWGSTWFTHVTLSSSQYKKFLDDAVLNITDPNEKIRKFAELAIKAENKT